MATVISPKKLIEVALPLDAINIAAAREKSIRHGHISTLHIWWARRPLAACRAVICAALWPDPADEHCPQSFRDPVSDEELPGALEMVLMKGRATRRRCRARSARKRRWAISKDC